MEELWFEYVEPLHFPSIPLSNESIWIESFWKSDVNKFQEYESTTFEFRWCVTSNIHQGIFFVFTIVLVFSIDVFPNISLQTIIDGKVAESLKLQFTWWTMILGEHHVCRMFEIQMNIWLIGGKGWTWLVGNTFEETKHLGRYSDARFGQDLKLKFSRDADVWLRFCIWRLIDIKKMKFDQDLCKNQSTLGAVVPLAMFQYKSSRGRVLYICSVIRFSHCRRFSLLFLLPPLFFLLSPPRSPLFEYFSSFIQITVFAMLSLYCCVAQLKLWTNWAALYFLILLKLSSTIFQRCLQKEMCYKYGKCHIWSGVTDP